jgi:FkbM family methyltransferase
MNTGTVSIDVETGAGFVQVECFRTMNSGATCSLILQGITYPDVPFVDGVQVVLDIGANVGAASMYFERLYPRAQIFAFEPSATAVTVLRRNLAHCDRVEIVDHGLFDRDFTAPLYLGDGDGLSNSVARTAENTSDTETGTFVAASHWLRSRGLEFIDVLKIDTEGAELAILNDMIDYLPAVKILHLEYHSEDDRRIIDRLLEPTHVLVAGRVLQVHRGELTYVARSAFPSEAALNRDAISVPPSESH